jgi:hypothetical protein
MLREAKSDFIAHRKLHGHDSGNTFSDETLCHTIEEIRTRRPSSLASIQDDQVQPMVAEKVRELRKRDWGRSTLLVLEENRSALFIEFAVSHEMQDMVPSVGEPIYESRQRRIFQIIDHHATPSFETGQRLCEEKALAVEIEVADFGRIGSHDEHPQRPFRRERQGGLAELQIANDRRAGREREGLIQVWFSEVLPGKAGELWNIRQP